MANTKRSKSSPRTTSKAAPTAGSNEAASEGAATPAPAAPLLAAVQAMSPDALQALAAQLGVSTTDPATVAQAVSPLVGLVQQLVATPDDNGADAGGEAGAKEGEESTVDADSAELAVGDIFTVAGEGGRATMSTEDWIILDTPLVDPPQMVSRIIEITGIRTLREAAALTLNDVRKIRGVGEAKASAFFAWRAEALRQARESSGNPGPVDLDPPRTIARLVRLSGAQTVEEVLKVDLRWLAEQRGVGPTRIRAWRRWVAGLRHELEHRAAHVPAVSTLQSMTARELFDKMEAQLGERERDIINGRYRQRLSLAELGERHDVTRERVRQLIQQTTALLRKDFQAQAFEVLQAEWCLGQLGRDILHRSLSNNPTISWEEVGFLADVATRDRWLLVDNDWLTTLSISQMRDYVAAVRGSVARDVFVPLERLDAIAESRPGMSRALVALVLMNDLGFRRKPDGTLFRNPKTVSMRTWIVHQMIAAGGAVHQNDMTRMVLAFEGKAADAVTEEQYNLYVRRVEAQLERAKDILRVDAGTFVHRSHLRMSKADEKRIVDWCMERLSGLTGPMSTHILIEELDAAGMSHPLLNHYVLKEFLKKRPEIHILRKSFVAWAATFQEEGTFLDDRLRAILAEAGEPMTVSELAQRLPSGVRYSPISIRAALFDADYARNTGMGRFEYVAPEN